ncbi:MAG: SecDF P1 head subdomain-containing protein [Limisphaerales bacterium]
MLKDAFVIESATGGDLGIELAEPTARHLRDLTTKAVGERIAIEVDGKVLSVPVVREPVPGGFITLHIGPPMETQNLVAALHRSK